MHQLMQSPSSYPVEYREPLDAEEISFPLRKGKKDLHLQAIVECRAAQAKSEGFKLVL
jgi:hypothetical protein